MSRFNRGSKVVVEGGVVWVLEDVRAEALEVNHAKRLVVLLVCAPSRDGFVYVVISSSSSKQSCSSGCTGEGTEPRFMVSELVLALKKFPNIEAREVCFARIPAVLALLAGDFVGEGCLEGDDGDNC
jgi:hypothetical protein